MWHELKRREINSKFRQEKEHWGDADIDGSIILKWISEGMKQYEVDSFKSRWTPMVDSCEHTNKPSGSIEFAQFLD